MSERGSFVTEYIYCKACFDAAWNVLNGHDKYLMATRVPAWGEPAIGIGGEASTVLPIIAGKIGGLYAGEELVEMETEYLPKIAERLCPGHDIRVAVLADVGSAMYRVAHPDRVRPLPNDRES